jgi:hypothetical protein
MLLAAVAIRYDRLEPSTIVGGNLDLDPVAHPGTLSYLRSKWDSYDCVDALDALSPAQFLSTALINGPTDREREILVRRLGLDGSHRQTLEEIAGDYGLTRERIGQLERGGLKKCRLGANRAQFKRYLETKENEVWRLLAGDRPFLPRRRVKAQAQLPGLLELSLEVVFGGAEGWLNRHAS